MYMHTGRFGFFGGFSLVYKFWAAVLLHVHLHRRILKRLLGRFASHGGILRLLMSNP